MSFGLYAEVKINWPSENSVAYVAKKKMFILKKVDVIGINKNIAFSKASLNSGYIFTVSIPIMDFKTDDKERDLEVSKLLNITKSKFLLFRSNKLDTDQLAALKRGELKTLSGSLQIGDKKFEVYFKMSLDGSYIKGEYQTTLSHFEIEPPSVGYGLVAKALDYINLKVRIRLRDI